jgi:hypothetical protein
MREVTIIPKMNLITEANMCKSAKSAIFNAIENSSRLSADDDIELLAEEIYAAIEPLIQQIMEMRLNQRIYFATKTRAALIRSKESEIRLDKYIGEIKEVQVLQSLIF